MDDRQSVTYPVFGFPGSLVVPSWDRVRIGDYTDRAANWLLRGRVAARSVIMRRHARKTLPPTLLLNSGGCQIKGLEQGMNQDA
jgi:hypothetical protein